MTDDLKPEFRHQLPESWVRERRTPLMSEVRSARRTRRRWPRRWRGLLLVPAAALVAAGGAAGGVSLLGGEPPSVHEVAECYPRAEKDAPGVAATQGNLKGPIESCRKEWRAGRVGNTTKAPPLVACLDGDVSNVYPGRSNEVCDRLGLEPLPDEFARRSVEFDKRMKSALKSCPPVERAKRITRAELDRAGRKSWGVAVRPDQDPVARTDCIDNFGTVESEGEPSRVELDYPVPELTAAQERRFMQRAAREQCREVAAGWISYAEDAAVNATECRYGGGGCTRPAVAAKDLRRQLARRRVEKRVAVDSDAPGRCFAGHDRSSRATITILSNPRAAR